MFFARARGPCYGSGIGSKYYQRWSSRSQFEGNLHIGHGGGSAAGSHIVSAGQSLRVVDKLVIGSDGLGYLQIDNGGTVDSEQGYIGYGPGASGSGVVVIGSGSIWNAQDTLNVGNNLPSQVDALLGVNNGALVRAGNTINVWQNGKITLQDGQLIAQQVQVREGGRLGGVGTVTLDPSGSLENSGVVAPGEYVLGAMMIDSGNFNQPIAGVLELKIGGIRPSQYDRLDVVQGRATLDGGLRVTLVDPLGGTDLFVPTANDQFTILTAGGGRFGTFQGECRLGHRKGHVLLE